MTASPGTRLRAAPDAWTAALDAVLREPGRVRPAFQPIFDLRRGVVAGFEMLARFDVPVQASPPEWLAAAQARGVGARLEARLMAIGLRARDELPPNTFLAVNAAPAALVAAEVQDVLRGRSLERLVVEITETVAVEDYAALDRALDRLRAAGAHVAVDDAGAGYASLQHVLRLKPSFVKLDRQLVAGIDRDAAKVALVEAMGSLASRLDAWLVAEGVERPQEREALAALGVPLAQGFGLAPPGRELAGDLRVPPAAGLRGSGVGLVAQREAPTVPLHDVDRVVRGDAAAGDAAAVVDGRGRAVGLLVRAGTGGWEHKPSPLACHPDERPPEVARRAMTRAPADRFDPVCCCDDAGRFLGLIAVDQLVHILASERDSS